jgi:two-component system cell cycle response regulator DivK
VSDELILIVEDNEKSMKLARDVLQFKGYRTLEAASVADAVSLAATHVPDLILMDIRLPDGDGTAALGGLRRDSRTAAIPVIAVTAFAMREDQQRFMNAGFDGYLTKPIDIKAFPDQVASFMRREK